jgi:hypothetical protein
MILSKIPRQSAVGSRWGEHSNPRPDFLILGSDFVLMRIFHRRNHLRTDKVQSEKPSKSSAMQLRELCGSDEKLYEALANFLLLDPRSQIPQLGETDSLVEQGNAAIASGNKLVARVDFEIAARIEIFRLNKESTRKCLLLAEQVSDSDKARQYHETILQDMEKVMEIAEVYYGIIPRRPQNSGQANTSVPENVVLVEASTK